MALIKPTTTGYGIVADYWRIETITIDKKMREASFILFLYLNKEATNNFDYRVITITDKANKDELFKKYFSERVEFTDIYNSCYTCAKELDDFFADAKDDEEELINLKSNI